MVTEKIDTAITTTTNVQLTSYLKHQTTTVSEHLINVGPITLPPTNLIYLTWGCVCTEEKREIYSSSTVCTRTRPEENWHMLDTGTNLLVTWRASQKLHNLLLLSTSTLNIKCDFSLVSYITKIFLDCFGLRPYMVPKVIDSTCRNS